MIALDPLEGYGYVLISIVPYKPDIITSPGDSMIAVLPYSAFKPLIGAVHNRVLETRQASEEEITAVYNDPRPMRVEFSRQVRERALDIKFGLTGCVTQVFCMAPLSALSALVIFSVFVWPVF